MPRTQTKFFGAVDYDADSVFHFPSGLPGFEDNRDFVFLRVSQSEPLMFLQSLSSRNLCFVLLPILVADPNYRLNLTPEELFDLDLPAEREPLIGEDILCATLICVAQGEVPTANLMAPVVVNLQKHIGMQVIHGESGYSHRHPLLLHEESALACS
jgi:flagellar assembly factor FliW